VEIINKNMYPPLSQLQNRIENQELNEYFKSNLYEMSTFNSNSTGLDPGTKLWVRTKPTGLPHTKFRVKIEHPQKGSAVFSLWGDETQQVAENWKVKGKDLKKIQKLIFLTGDSLRNHINGVEDSAELSAALKSAKIEVEQV